MRPGEARTDCEHSGRTRCDITPGGPGTPREGLVDTLWEIRQEARAK